MDGYKLVAVGSGLHWSKEWKTFTDFLMHYIKKLLTDEFGPSWGPDGLKQPVSERHPLLRWYDALCQLQLRTQNESEPTAGVYESTLDGPSAAYLMVAYDLYVLQHNQSLQKSVLRRLKDRETFRAARYELFVAATMIRAGYAITFEDETDNKRKHPEFVASHKRTGQVVAVEAKSKWRKGIVEWKGPIPSREEFRLGIADLLESAIDKRPGMPYVIFIDANIPPDLAAEDRERWLSEVELTLADLARRWERDGEQSTPFSAMVLTNLPHDYGEPGGIDPQRVMLTTWPLNPAFPFANVHMISEIEVAVAQYGHFPQHFDNEALL